MSADAPIAVVGMGCVFPGAEDPRTFWRNILAKLDASREVPAGRWIVDPREALAAGPETDRVYSTRGCFVESFAPDPTGLRIAPELLSALDPVYHMTLHAGRQAFLDGKTADLDLSQIGVILAAIALPTDASSAITREIMGQAFEEALFEQAAAAGLRTDRHGRDAGPARRLLTHPLNGRVTALPAALLAKALGLGGGSYTLDAACASSLYAVKLACDELRAGRARAMLAGGSESA